MHNVFSFSHFKKGKPFILIVFNDKESGLDLFVHVRTYPACWVYLPVLLLSRWNNSLWHNSRHRTHVQNSLILRCDGHPDTKSEACVKFCGKQTVVRVRRYRLKGKCEENWIISYVSSTEQKIPRNVIYIDLKAKLCRNIKTFRPKQLNWFLNRTHNTNSNLATFCRYVNFTF